MKHTWVYTWKMMLWAAIAVVTGVGIGWLIPERVAPPSEMSQLAIGGVMVAAIIAGAVFWHFIFKRKKVDVAFPFSLIAGYGVAVVGQGVALNVFGVDVYRGVPLVIALAVYGAVTYVTWKMIHRMRESWDNVKKYANTWNALMAIALGSAGAVIGWKFAPWVAMLVLLAAAIYDAIAVWKLKTMQQMAENFVRMRAFPGFIVPKDEEEKVAMLGGGDTFFITMVAVSFFKTSIPMGVLAAAGMTLAVLLLFVFSEKGKSYPALPYIVAGLLASMATWLIM